MNKLRTILTWGLLAAVTHVMGYTITVSPTQIEAGKTTNFIINLNNTETNLTAYQMKLFLPSGVTVQKKANGKYAYTANSDRHDGEFTFTVKDAADGSVLITCFSADKDVITGTSGELIRLPIDVASSVTTSLQGRIKEIEFSDVNNQAYNISDVNFTLTMEGGETPPVVTGDVTVSVPNVAITAGGSTNLIVNMLTELTNLTAYQMKLFLPEGVTIQKKANGKYAYTANSDRHDGEFTFTVKDAADGSILITCFSADKDVITGNSGELIRLPIEVAPSVTTSLQGSLKEIEFSDVNNQAYNISDVNFTLTLEGETSPNITFSDANVKAFCVSNWDSNGDGELSEAEAAAVTDLGTVFRGNTSITSFNELRYFTGLDSICSNAFRDCRSLTSVTLPSSVTSICVGTFRATGLTSITIPNSVTSIEQDAFCDCQDLTTVTIPGSVANIGKAAFYVCRKLSSVTLGTGVESIGNNAFHYCSSLTSISIPNSVRSIGFCSFADCAMTSITIPNSVTSIDGYAFAGNANLTSVTMPDNIITFTGGWAFGDNNNIESVYITNLATWLGTAFPSGNNPLRSGAKLYLNNVEVKDLIIPEGTTAILAAAFEGCESLTSVTIPSSVTSIDGWAFASCSNLISITIPNSVTTIGDCAFRSTAITSLTIPASVTNIAVSANSGGLTEDCTSLMNIYVEEGNSRYYSENGVLFTEDEEFVGANGKAIVLFPQGRRGSYEIPNDVTVIASRAFVSCKGLTSVVIPKSVTTIEGEYAFHGCENLTSVTIPSSMTSIGYGSFFNNYSLADVFCYAENVPETSSWAFYGSPLSSATLHVPVGSIDAYSTTAPWSGFGTIVAIEDNSNMEINGIYYALDKNNRTAEVISNPNGYSGTVVIPESVTFSNNTYSVTSIGEGAFAGCEGLTSITIPNSVTSISQNAFAGITIRKVFWLTNTPPSGYENLKGYINYVLNNSYSSLSNVRVYPYLASMFELNGVKYVPVSPSEHICDAVDCVQNETAKDLNISSVTYQGITMKVKNVMPYLAYENKYIESLSVDIEGNIPIRAFDNCSNLKSVNLGEKVTGIGEYAFYGCISLSSITIGSSVTSIGNSAFRECSGLTSVSIPGSVTSIGESAFSDCKGLTSINIPEGLTSIGYRTFYGCSSLTSIKIPNSVTSIDNSAFSSCIGLTSVTIGNGVTNIGNYVFSNCSSLTSITIPDAVTSISYRAFSGCSRLTEIYCLAEEVPVTSLNAFDNTPINNVTLHVPASAIDKYKATKPWSGFGTIVTIEKRESITMTDEFATFSCSEDLDFSGSDLRAYIASGFNKATNQVLLTRIKDVPAGTGIFLVGKPGTTYTIPYAETSSIYMNFFQANLETSTIYATTDNYSNYIFGEQSGEIGFYPVVDYETLLAQTAYLQLPSSFVAAGVKVNVVFEEDIIDGIEDFRISDGDETIYDLAGRRLGKIQRGINIVNGKKVMVK